jgi:hypothetical protein
MPTLKGCAKTSAKETAESGPDVRSISQWKGAREGGAMVFLRKMDRISPTQRPGLRQEEPVNMPAIHCVPLRATWENSKPDN